MDCAAGVARSDCLQPDSCSSIPVPHQTPSPETVTCMHQVVEREFLKSKSQALGENIRSGGKNNQSQKTFLLRSEKKAVLLI